MFYCVETLSHSTGSDMSESYNYFLTKEEALQQFTPGEEEVNDYDYWSWSVCHEPYPVNEIEDMSHAGYVYLGPGIEHTCALPPTTDNLDINDLCIGKSGIGKPRRRFR